MGRAPSGARVPGGEAQPCPVLVQGPCAQAHHHPGPRLPQSRAAGAGRFHSRATVQATLAALWRKGHAERGRASGPRGSWGYRPAHTREDYLTRRVLAVLAYSPDPEGTLTCVIAHVTAPWPRAGRRAAVHGDPGRGPDRRRPGRRRAPAW